MDFKKNADFKSVKELAVSMFYYASGSILGPLLIFGGLGYLADRLRGSGPMFLLIGVFFAFVITNILLFKKVKKINQLIEKYNKKPAVADSAMPKDKSLE